MHLATRSSLRATRQHVPDSANGHDAFSCVTEFPSEMTDMHVQCAVERCRLPAADSQHEPFPQHGLTQSAHQMFQSSSSIAVQSTLAPFTETMRVAGSTRISPASRNRVNTVPDGPPVLLSTARTRATSSRGSTGREMQSSAPLSSSVAATPGSQSAAMTMSGT